MRRNCSKFQGNEHIPIFIFIHLSWWHSLQSSPRARVRARFLSIACLFVCSLIRSFSVLYIWLCFLSRCSDFSLILRLHMRAGYKIYDIYVCINFECGWFRCVVAMLELEILYTNILHLSIDLSLFYDDSQLMCWTIEPWVSTIIRTCWQTTHQITCIYIEHIQIHTHSPDELNCVFVCMFVCLYDWIVGSFCWVQTNARQIALPVLSFRPPP